MKEHRTKCIAAVTIITGALATQVLGSDWPHGHGGPNGPPPEAIDACKDKKEGDSVEFTSPNGDTIKAICKQIDSRLAAMPINWPGRGPDGPPPEEDNSKNQ